MPMTSARQIIFTPLSRATVSDSIFPDWHAPMRSPGRSPRRKKCIAWCADLRKRLSLRESSTWIIICRRIPIDKTSCGLIDAHEFAQCPDALDVHWRATAGGAAIPAGESPEPRRAALRGLTKIVAYTWDETYTLPENFFLAYQRSGNQRYRDLACRFIEEDYFGPLAEGKNVLPGEHAYSHVNAFSSAMQSYLVLGAGKVSARGHQWLSHGAGTELCHRRVGTGRSLRDSRTRPAATHSLGTTHASFETPCGAYGHFKITRYLLRVTKDSRYGDSMERVLYNTIAGATPILADGTSFYYSDYTTTPRKFITETSGRAVQARFPQLTADYGISSYYQSQRRYLRESVPAVARVVVAKRYASARSRRPREYPTANTTQMQFTMPRPETFTVYVRIPAWAGAKSAPRSERRKAQRLKLVPGKVSGGAAHLERWRPNRTGTGNAASAGSCRRAEPLSRRVDAWSGCDVWDRTHPRASHPQAVTLGGSLVGIQGGFEGANGYGRGDHAALRIHHERELPVVSDGGGLAQTRLTFPDLISAEKFESSKSDCWVFRNMPMTVAPASRDARVT